MSIPRLAAEVQDEAVKRAQAAITMQLGIVPKDDWDLINAGIQAGFLGGLLTLMDHGILPGAFEEPRR